MIRMLCPVITLAILVAGCGDTAISTSDRVGSDQTDAPGGLGLTQVALPKTLPADIPIYPGAKPIHVGTSEGGIRQSPATFIQMTSTASLNKVHAFYKKSLKDRSWKIKHSSSNSSPAISSAMVAARKGKAIPASDDQ